MLLRPPVRRLPIVSAVGAIGAAATDLTVHVVAVIPGLAIGAQSLASQMIAVALTTEAAVTITGALTQGPLTPVQVAGARHQRRLPVALARRRTALARCSQMRAPSTR